jgi:hypothetical protein
MIDRSSRALLRASAGTEGDQVKYVAILLFCGVMTMGAVQAEAGDLAKASQSPIGNMVSLPFQNNTSFGIGPDSAVSNGG